MTGDGTLYTVPFNATTFNVGSAFNTGTGIFTAPITGKYQFNWTSLILNLDGSSDTLISQLVTTTQTIYGYYGSSNTQNSSHATLLTASVFVLMSAGNTAKIQVQNSGTTKTVSVGGNTDLTQGLCCFSGYLVC